MLPSSKQHALTQLSAHLCLGVSLPSPPLTFQFTINWELTFQFSFLRPIPMGIVWLGDKVWPECQCAVLYNRWNRLWAKLIEYHQRLQQLSMQTIEHVFQHALPSPCLCWDKNRREKKIQYNWLNWKYGCIICWDFCYYYSFVFEFVCVCVIVWLCDCVDIFVNVYCIDIMC